MKWFFAVAIAAIVLTACGNGSDNVATDGSAGSDMDHDMDAMGDDAIDFGRPGKPAGADREVRVDAVDSLAFDPATIEVERGETITFVVTNVGENPHEFVLGDEDFQMAHQEEMEMEMDGMTERRNAIELEPGETKRLTWTFTDAGEVLYGCHEPGHYEGGMVGTINIA
jgi:uncharacterized cupredoxin-like copper-binding protein